MPLFFPMLLVAAAGIFLAVTDGENPDGFSSEDACLARLDEMKRLVPPWVEQNIGLPQGSAEVLEATCQAKEPGQPA
jgi:hypothetical protein